MSATVLVLGGTAEGRRLASRATAAGFDVVSSLAGRTDEAQRPVGRVRVGGFGGREGLAAYLRSAAIDAVVVATHPFAARIAASAAWACAATGVPVVLLRRPPWQEQPGDRWHRVPDLPAAAAVMPTLGTRAFVTTGARGLGAFGGIDTVDFVIRCIAPPDEPLPPRSQVILARGPYTVAGERALLREHAIDVVVTKDSGGTLTGAKLVAARELGIPVVMVDRPPTPDIPRVDDVAAAMEWLRAL